MGFLGSVVAMPQYAVFVRAQSGKASSISTHDFPEHLREGDRVDFQGQSWVVVEVRPGETIPAVVLQFPER